MEIRYVDTICIASYDEKDQSKITLIKSPAEAVADAGKGWLLVDDLVDTGATMRAAKELLPESHVATVYAKPGGMPYVDTFVHEVAQAVWIFFTWDTDLAYTTPMMARKNPIPAPR